MLARGPEKGRGLEGVGGGGCSSRLELYLNRKRYNVKDTARLPVVASVHERSPVRACIKLTVKEFILTLLEKKMN